MTRDEMWQLVQVVITTWPQLSTQWQTATYADSLHAAVARVPLAVAKAGVARWVLQHNRPPTMEGLLGVIEQVQAEQRQASARQPVQWPRAEEVPMEDREVAREALKAMHALVEKQLAQVPTGGYRRNPEAIRAMIREKGLTHYDISV